MSDQTRAWHYKEAKTENDIRRHVDAVDDHAVVVDTPMSDHPRAWQREAAKSKVKTPEKSHMRRNPKAVKIDEDRLRQNVNKGHLERQNFDVQSESIAHRRECELPEGGDHE